MGIHKMAALKRFPNFFLKKKSTKESNSPNTSHLFIISGDAKALFLDPLLLFRFSGFVEN